MISRAQQILLKRAQREARLSDDDYRESLQMIAGVRSSTSPTITDRQLDTLLAFFEAIFWKAVDDGTLQSSGRTDAVFRQRHYWASKNTKQETSRDRFTGQNLGRAIADLESQLALLGCGGSYCAAIRKNVTHGRADAHALHLYHSALERTLKAKSNQVDRERIPF